MWFASYLYQSGVITGDQFAEAVTTQLQRRPLIGQVAVNEKALKPQQLLSVLAAQSEDHSRSFGSIARELGYISEQELSHLIVKQAQSVESLAEILVEFGALTQEQVEVELEKAHQAMERLAQEGKLGDSPQALLVSNMPGH